MEGMMDDHKMNRMADDVHLLAAPVRIAADWIKILVFIAVLPIVFIVSLGNWILTGKPIMSPDEIWLTKVLLTVLSPWITTLTYIFCKHVREMGGTSIGALCRTSSCSSQLF
jgi:hypothetical protein